MPAAVTALARTHERSIVRCREPANNDAVQKCDKIRVISDFPACYIFLALCDTEVRSLASHALLFALLCKPQAEKYHSALGQSPGAIALMEIAP
jgi:hypothetical protein